MKISDAIKSLELCLENFGDVECKFTETNEGQPAVELSDVDTTSQHDIEEDVARRFNACFPTKDIFIPSRN
jgi:hypothetical protein